MIEKTNSFNRDGKEFCVYTLSNENGIEVDILNYGGRIIRISVPDCNGKYDDIVVGRERAEDYLENNPYFGAIVGRVANRISGAKFTLDDQIFTLDANEKPNNLHSGSAGFDKKIFNSYDLNNQLILTSFSPDGEGGFPGKMKVIITYSLTNDNELIIDYNAVCDKDTPCNFTNHTYFNLGGVKCENILSHELELKSDNITPTDEQMIPTGDIKNIKGTAYDFTIPKLIGQDIEKVGGYDTNYIINRNKTGLFYSACLYHSKTNREMKVYTTCPCIQVYTGNGLEGEKGKRDYCKYAGVCLETQAYPNAVNTPNFPTIILKKNQVYNNTTVYKFTQRIK